MWLGYKIFFCPAVCDRKVLWNETFCSVSCFLQHALPHKCDNPCVITSCASKNYACASGGDKPPTEWAETCFFFKHPYTAIICRTAIATAQCSFTSVTSVTFCVTFHRSTEGSILHSLRPQRQIELLLAKVLQMSHRCHTVLNSTK